jgi:hypothetical protein
VITQRNIDVGSLIRTDATSGTSMFSLVHSKVIRVWVYVPQDDAFGVSPGVEAVIRVPTMPNLTFRDTVTRIANAMQPGTRALLTEVDIPNPDGALQPGVYCSVELKIPRKSPALIVPASAIIFNQNGMQVAMVNDGVAHLARRSRSARVSKTATRSSCNRPSIWPTATKFGSFRSRPLPRHSPRNNEERDDGSRHSCTCGWQNQRNCRKRTPSSLAPYALRQHGCPDAKLPRSNGRVVGERCAGRQGGERFRQHRIAARR